MRVNNPTKAPDRIWNTARSVLAITRH
ncbi:uncharacterized protein METZ01_LOCUS415741, partial [marine metagenome]